MRKRSDGTRRTSFRHTMASFGSTCTPICRRARTWSSTGTGIRFTTDRRLTGRAFSATISNPDAPTRRSAGLRTNCTVSGRRSSTSSARIQVAILYSNDSYYGIEFMKFSDHADYRTVLQQMYHVLYGTMSAWISCFPESTNFSDYKVIVVPPLYVASDALLNKLVDYVRNGGHVVMAFKSGFTNEFDTVRWTTMPGRLREAAGFHYQEFSNLRQPLALKGDPVPLGTDNKVSDWAEMLTLDSAEGLAFTTIRSSRSIPAITRNHFGKGISHLRGNGA